MLNTFLMESQNLFPKNQTVNSIAATSAFFKIFSDFHTTVNCHYILYCQVCFPSYWAGLSENKFFQEVKKSTKSLVFIEKCDVVQQLRSNFSNKRFIFQRVILFLKWKPFNLFSVLTLFRCQNIHRFSRIDDCLE